MVAALPARERRDRQPTVRFTPTVSQVKKRECTSKAPSKYAIAFAPHRFAMPTCTVREQRSESRLCIAQITHNPWLHSPSIRTCRSHRTHAYTAIPFSSRADLPPLTHETSRMYCPRRLPKGYWKVHGRWAHGPRPTSSCRSFDTGLKQVIRYTFCPRTAPSACVPCPREPAPRLIFVPSWLLSSQLLSRAHAEQSATAGRRPSVAQAGIIILFEFRALATA